MSNIVSTIVPTDIAGLLDSWIEAERNGVEFPVPFDLAYPMAGYARKDSAKRYLPKSASGILYHVSRIESKGRPVEQIALSVAGFEHMCLMADTAEGHQIREYFRDARSKWELTKQVAPQVASEIEALHLRLAISQQEAIAAVANNEAQKLRHYVATTLPKATGDRILGVTEIRETEYRTKVVDETGFILNSGETLTKTQLAERYGFVSKTGKADTKTVTGLIEQAISAGAIKNPWRDVRVVASSGFDVEQVDKLDRFFKASPADRQRWIGE